MLSRFECSLSEMQNLILSVISLVKKLILGSTMGFFDVYSRSKALGDMLSSFEYSLCAL
ncbi:hypothetical protein HC248_03291 [Polaromonas vacuolata]|uniref:Uncharacterized protein n=1 Tax=Polaromonas vacuolata TaxID=37448 RepID=A0A6H2HDJ1_9BURK|nr:hypothetical protein HC248_03291 [Polaromonas vacuolata]